MSTAPWHPREWDAGTYDRVSTPQQSWGKRVLDRLVLHGGEHVRLNIEAALPSEGA